MSSHVGTDVYVFDDGVVVLSQHQDNPVVVKNITELYVLLTFWEFDRSEIDYSIKMLKDGDNHANYGIMDSICFTSRKTEEEFEEAISKYAKYRMVC